MVDVKPAAMLLKPRPQFATSVSGGKHKGRVVKSYLPVATAAALNAVSLFI